MASFDDRSAVLWDVVLGGVSWTDALQEIATTTGALMALLVRQGPRDWEYWEYWSCSINDRDTAVSALMDPDRNPITRGMNFAAVGATRDRRELIGDDAFRRNEALAMIREHGAFHGLLCKLEGSPAMQAGFGISFPEDRGDTCAERARDFAAWIRPLQRAIRAHSVLEAAMAYQLAYSEALSMVGVGAVAVDAGLTIRQANAEAERIFAAADGIESRLGHLTVATPAGQQRLQRRILGAWQVPDQDAGSPIHVSRRTGPPDYLVDVVPARGIRATAIVLITDPVAANSLPDLQRIMRRFGLTPCEARVARLAPLALSKVQIAQHLGLSENTVKSHLISARAKVGARNMVDLALVMQRA